MTIQSVGVVAMRRPPHRRANRPCPPACLIKQRSESDTQGLTPSRPSQHITSIVRGTLRLCFYSGGPVAPMAAAICCLTCGLQAPAPLEDSTASPKTARRQASGHRQCSSSLLQTPPRRPDPSDGGGGTATTTRWMRRLSSHHCCCRMRWSLSGSRLARHGHIARGHSSAL